MLDLKQRGVSLEMDVFYQLGVRLEYLRYVHAALGHMSRIRCKADEL